MIFFILLSKNNYNSLEAYPIGAILGIIGGIVVCLYLCHAINVCICLAYLCVFQLDFSPSIDFRLQ